MYVCIHVFLSHSLLTIIITTTTTTTIINPLFPFLPTNQPNTGSVELAQGSAGSTYLSAFRGQGAVERSPEPSNGREPVSACAITGIACRLTYPLCRQVGWLVGRFVGCRLTTCIINIIIIIIIIIITIIIIIMII